MNQPLINGEAYSWSQVVCNILGVDVAGITAISYSESEEKTNLYGAGNRPVARSRGKIEPEASVTLYMSEIEALQRKSPTGRIEDLGVFDITIAYIPKSGNGVVRHILRNCEFVNNSRELEIDGTEIVVELELILSHIDWT